jgi:hypothetical protein
MLEYAAVSSSSYDIDSLVAKLNERAAAGWSVVSVVTTGGEVSAILSRANGDATETTAPAVAVSEPDVEAAPEPAFEPAAFEPAAFEPAAFEPVTEALPIAEPEIEPEPVVEAAPVPAAAWEPEPVQEPAGWAVAPDPAPPAPAVTTTTWDPTPAAAPAPAVTYQPAPAVTYEPAPVAAYQPSTYTPEPAPAPAPAPAPVVTTPSGWYPDPSGRYEMRYWDGMAWTEHVSRSGQQYTDPPVA